MQKKFNEPQTQFKNYADSKYIFWTKVYADIGRTLYSRQVFKTQNARSWVNIEHVYPMSWVARNLECYDREWCRKTSSRFNQIEADMHNMYPARRDLNKARGSRSFGMVMGEPRLFEQFDFEIDTHKGHVEPTKTSRGNIARAMFYIADTYDMNIFSSQLRLLKQWNRIDPPSEHEKWRNRRIESLQGNRNHFIDSPQDANKL